MIKNNRPNPGKWILFASLALAVLALALWFDASPRAAAQEVANKPDAPGSLSLNLETGRLPTLRELFATSVIINGVILALSVVSLAMFGFFMLTIHPRALAPVEFVDDVTKLVLNQQYEQAADLCRNHRHIFIASIIQRCVENAGKNHSVILDMLDAEGRRRAEILWNRVSYLADVSNVAPMLGLLGTVVGMIKAFFLLPTQSLSISSRALSQGIAEAMSTTMFGLIVAITALVFYSITRARVTRTLAETEQVAHSLADHIKRGSA